ncbi:hypothetical protein C8T65DRAFT_693414 [Cerioporus squamosus]|nr:hypothetical protein C8T65DRAFT_693414 [Cerioporus squamosus]
MPPKPRPVRKSSATSNAPSTTPAAKDAAASSASTSMPPPPDPVPPLGILEAEVTALSSCLQNAVVKTGQVYGFYTDVKRLGIQQYAPRPPRSLMSSLGREIVKYDQLCDAMESHLLRAITVLQRDLAREEQRLKAEEEAAAAAAAAKASSPSAASVTTPPGSPTPSTQTDVPMDGSLRPRLTPIGITPARRQSTISLSSLSRPAFPHKLDLSASALRIHPDEMIPSGLSSPVTLAPRSARASLPPDLVMAALGDAANRGVDIDLTLDGDIDMAGPSSDGQVREMGSLDPALGSSADKPIELDLDMDMDVGYFGTPAQAPGGADTNLFGPDAGSQMVKPKEEQIDMDILSALQSVEASGDGEDIFASLRGASAGGDAPTSAPSGSDLQKGPATAPSPGTILAGFTAGTSQPGDSASAAAPAEPGQGASFDFDISTLGDNFFAQPATSGAMDMMGMDDIFNMGANPSEGGTSGGTASGSSS